MDLILTSQDGRDIHVACAGTVSQATLRPNTDPLREVIGEDGYAGNIYLSLAQTHFIDSSGMAWLLERNKACKAAGGKLVIHSVPPMVRQALELLKLQRVLTIESDLPSRKAVTGGTE